MPDIPVRFHHCPDCQVTLAPDSEINHGRVLLRVVMKMLDDALCPHIDVSDVDNWIAKRVALRHEVNEMLGGPEDAHNEEVPAGAD